MFQFYLRAHGLALSWVGTGRVIFSLNYSEADFEEVVRRFVAAAEAMRSDGWWTCAPQLSDKAISDFENATIFCNVLAHQDKVVVAFHALF